MLRILHNLKQYSGEKQFQTECTLKQIDQSLRHFDLSEYRRVLSDVAIWIYQVFVDSSSSLHRRVHLIPTIEIVKLTSAGLKWLVLSLKISLENNILVTDVSSCY